MDMTLDEALAEIDRWRLAASKEGLSIAEYAERARRAGDRLQSQLPEPLPEAPWPPRPRHPDQVPA